MTRIMYQDPFRVKQSKHKAINQSRPVKEESRLGPDTLFRPFFLVCFPVGSMLRLWGGAVGFRRHVVSCDGFWVWERVWGREGGRLGLARMVVCFVSRSARGRVGGRLYEVRFCFMEGEGSGMTACCVSVGGMGGIVSYRIERCARWRKVRVVECGGTCERVTVVVFTAFGFLVSLSKVAVAAAISAVQVLYQSRSYVSSRKASGGTSLN